MKTRLNNVLAICDKLSQNNKSTTVKDISVFKKDMRNSKITLASVAIKFEGYGIKWFIYDYFYRPSTLCIP